MQLFSFQALGFNIPQSLEIKDTVLQPDGLLLFFYSKKKVNGPMYRAAAAEE
jgi:hypothetical protein